GHNETAFTTAHLSDALDDGFQHLLTLHGKERLKKFYQSHHDALKILERIIQEEEIDCDYQKVPGYLFLGKDEDQHFLAKELLAAEEAGVEDLKLSSDFPESFFELGPALRFENQAQIHPLKFIDGIIHAIRRRGGLIFENTQAQEFHETPEATYVITENGHRVDCKAIVLATNGPSTSNTLYFKQAAYRTYAMAMKIEKNSIIPALFWDTQDSYHYVRTQPGPTKEYDILIVGGEDHRVGEGHPEKAFENLQIWIAERLGMPNLEVLAAWSGQIMEPVDGIAFIGRSSGKKNIFFVTGDSGHGFTHSATASKLLTTLIQGHHHELEELFSPRRIAMKALHDYFSENANTAMQYADWILPTHSLETLENNEGCVIQEGIHKVAVYRDDLGQLHKLSAICPHMKGLVKWNSLEKTWDCPCHGSRFSNLGQCLHAPATEDLKPIDRLERPPDPNYSSSSKSSN
ncbi:MAG: FAD-dependent oxidoreductase, partial [Bdellovibrio sp.]|nr:FAD-dependent oxidoreductase [Bdellovibrio sp.]